MNEKNNVTASDIPLGLGMAFAQNTDAMKRFSSLSKAEQESVIERAHNVSSKKEMQKLVSELGAQG